MERKLNVDIINSDAYGIHEYLQNAPKRLRNIMALCLFIK